MKGLLFAVVSLLSGSAIASSYQSCEFLATSGVAQPVARMGDSVQKYQHVVSLEIYAAVSLGGHTNCDGYIGETKHLIVDNVQDFVEGETVAVKYTYITSNSPTGFVFSESWSLIEEGGLIHLSCSQIDRMLPRYEISLRRPLGPVLADAVYYDAMVRQDATILAQVRAARVEEDQQNNNLQRIQLAQNMVFKFKLPAGAGREDAELHLPNGIVKQMSCMVYE